MTDLDAAVVTADLCLGFGASATPASKGCRPAPTCSSALAEASRRWPGRNRASDGICGDPAHQARVSDHNPDASGYAHAFDLTHAPGVGLDTYRLADQLRRRALAGDEPRVKYVISNHRIASGPGWAWRSYSGANPHTAHMHVSVTSAATHDTSPWWGFLDEAQFDTLGPEDRELLDRIRADVAVVRALIG